jgi:Uma2 family endonuclease
MALATPNDYEAWKYQGIALAASGKYQDAITSFDQALNLNPNYSEAFYNKACCYILLGNIEQAIENLQQAIYLDSKKWIAKAKTDSHFDQLQENRHFQALMDGEIRIIHHNVSWEEFETLLTEKGDNNFPRVAYDRGVLEIVMPSNKHERFNRRIADFIKHLADELNYDYCEDHGSTTWKRQDLLKGVEPDSCFYIQSAVKILDKIEDEIDLYQDPPPDLVLEVDYTSPSKRRMSIYSALGVPELWVYDLKELRIYQLQNGEYQETENSLAFPGFPVKEIPDFIHRNMKVTRKEFKKALREWVEKVM